MKIHYSLALNHLICGSFFLIFEINYLIFEKINFTLQNDLTYPVQLKMSKTKLTLNIGSAYKFAKTSGEKIYYIQPNGNNKLILTIQKADENKTFKLSKLISRE